MAVSAKEKAKAKAKGYDGSMEVVKTEDRIDTIIRQAIGREPFFTFPRATDTPVQWIQLLHALDQQGVSNSFPELPGWPLLYPVKVQLQKCDKCSREFCSTINYRRHIRAHHRLKKLDKDSTKNRDLLGAYWDKLSIEEAKEVVSFENVMLEEVPASSILEALTTLLQKPGFSSLPQYYLRAGAALLDIVHSQSSCFPLSSQELFTILDDASEKTCLCGTAVSMQRYIFDGEAGKIGLEPRNLVACTCFLLEQKLVKAWLADKDAEALRCHRQLVEEEEAAQKRQAEILERRRQKKLRQKDQKAREQRHEAEIEEHIGSAEDDLSAAEASLATIDSEAHNLETFIDSAPSYDPFQCRDTNVGLDGVQSSYNLGSDQYIERRSARRPNRRLTAVSRQKGLQKSQWAVANDSHTSQNSTLSKIEVIQKYGTHRDHRVATVANGSRVWSPKSKPGIDRMVPEARVEKEPDLDKDHEVLIGSISITLGNCSQSERNAVASRADCNVDNLANQNSSQNKPLNPDFVQNGNNMATKLWRPVSRHETKNPLPVQSGETEVNTIHENGDCQNQSDPSCLRSCSTDGSDVGFEINVSNIEGIMDPGSLQLLSSHAAKIFLEQRWKEAMSSNHLLLIVSDYEPPGCQEIQDSRMAVCQSSEVTVKRLAAASKVAKSNHRMKPEKGTKIKYIPKQKTAA
ncbi:uncharacterized protein LOC130982297 [Arachis stenosperma]|uniref:uncharacterized protein LOC130982297 n=1 Tax=Arachis stenosperma TaxID=217475 RepID=UPI0025AB7495|nr:uncharacterized protein LOC130982297 [Arachis stenosperma]XP_057762236.1 uncharacterized protein LOC130982297 [Arachis stenosperma]